jgi:hypothetical protein
VLNFPSGVRAPDGILFGYCKRFLRIDHCRVVNDHVLFAHNPPAETPHTLYIHAPLLLAPLARKAERKRPSGFVSPLVLSQRTRIVLLKCGRFWLTKKRMCQGRKRDFFSLKEK